MDKFELLPCDTKESYNDNFCLYTFGLMAGVVCICICVVVFKLYHTNTLYTLHKKIASHEMSIEATRTENAGLRETLTLVNSLAAQEDAIIIPKMTRGMRNKNPLNIVALSGKNAWFGQIGKDETNHAVFKTFEHGIRAGFLVLKKYYEERSIDTPSKIVARFCEGNRESYAAHIGKSLGLGVNEKFDVIKRMPELLKSMIEFENGFQPFPERMFTPYYAR